ncbi:MAG: ABC transporter permease [Bryobacteraceae bacterium]
MNDLRYAARMLAKAPGFTAVAVGLLAAGIGANAVIFSALDAVLLRPLPVKHPQELVRMVQKTPQLGTRSSFVYAFYEALRDHSTTLAAVFGEEEWRVAMNEPRPAEQIQVNVVTPEFFDVLGARAVLGRTLSANDAKNNPGMIPAVLSYGFWRRRFDGGPGVIGGTIVLHGHKFAVVGVMPREFNGTSIDTSPDVRLPLRAALLLFDWGDRPPDLSGLVNLSLAGRLRPGATRAQAQAECYTLWRGATEAFAKTHPNFSPAELEAELRRGMEVAPLGRGTSILRDRFANALELLIASAGLLLAMVCANIAGLLLARGAARTEEIAVRLAVGATRARLVRQMLTESALLAALGSVAGVIVALFSTPLLVRALPPMRDLYTARVALSLNIGVDRRVLLFSFAVSAITVLLFGLAPAIGASRASLDSVLRGARASGGWRGRRILIVFQIALCTVLLAGAGLLARTLEQLRGVDPGFDLDRIVTFTTDPSLAGYTTAQAQSLRLALTGRVRQIPGIASVAVASRPVMRGSGIKTTVAPAGRQVMPADFLNTSMNAVTPGYFDTMGMHFLAGRDFTPADERSQKPPRSVIVNQAFAAHFSLGRDPIGLRFGNSQAPEANEIVGVVSDAKYRSLREPMTPTFYSVWLDQNDELQLEVRTRVRPQSIIEPVRRALAALDPALPFTEIEVMSDEVHASTASERLTAALASIFGALAAVLAAVGIYGLLAYAVSERRREIGIRMALGARPSDIGGMIGKQALVMVASGVALGLCAAGIIAPWIRALLFGVAPADPATFTAAALLVALVAAAATALPVLQAVRVDPAAALRQEN